MPARLRRRRQTSALLAPLLALALLSGCGGAGASQGDPSATASATATATATAQPTATATSIPTTTAASGSCGKYFPPTAALTPANGLVVTQYSGLGNLAYPSVQIPSGQSAAPMLEPMSAIPSYWAANTTPVVVPRLTEGGGGYVLAICNPSSQPHTISAVQVTIAKMTPFTDQLNAWQPCSGAYSPVYKSVSGGCGGGDGQDIALHAAFQPSDNAGATVTAQQLNVNPAGPGYPFGVKMPVTVQPGKSLTIEVGVTQPSVAGYYTYSFALTVDGASTGTVAYSLMSLLAPVARQWSGAACETSAMLALIAKEPTPTARTAYICPVS